MEEVFLPSVELVSQPPAKVASTTPAEVTSPSLVAVTSIEVLAFPPPPQGISPTLLEEMLTVSPEADVMEDNADSARDPHLPHPLCFWASN